MEKVGLIMAVVSSMALGFVLGREYTKSECGKVLEGLRKAGFLKMPGLDDIISEMEDGDEGDG